MKYLFCLLTIVFLGIACHPNPANYTVPSGYRTCKSDLDCHPGEYCGFVGVDTYAVCRQGISEDINLQK